jgi:AcrR family transcriptional regulator
MTPSKATQTNHQRGRSARASLSKTPCAHIPALGGSRKATSQARSRETVEAILEAAACLLEEQDFHAASTNAMARRAGVSIGSLYQYFASREDVFRALVAQHAGEAHEHARKALTPVLLGKRKASQVLPEFLRDLIRMHQARPALMQAMSTQLAHLATEEDRQREAHAMSEWVDRMAAIMPGPPEAAKAKSWMIAEITAHLARRLAHEPPKGLKIGALVAAYGNLVTHLLG